MEFSIKAGWVGPRCPGFPLKKKQDLSRKCSAWKDFLLIFLFNPLPQLNIVGGVGSGRGQFLRFRSVYITNNSLPLSIKPFKKFLWFVRGGVLSLNLSQAEYFLQDQEICQQNHRWQNSRIGKSCYMIFFLVYTLDHLIKLLSTGYGL